MWGKVLTLDQFQRRGWSNWCFLCLGHEESIDNLLLHYETIRVLWELIFVLFGVSWVLSLSVKDILLGWHGSFEGKKRKKVGKEVLCACFGQFGRQRTTLHFFELLFWRLFSIQFYLFYLSRKRNNIAFDSDIFSIQKLKRDFVSFLWFKSKLFLDDCPLTLVGFC